MKIEWRLLEYSEDIPAKNLALDEALMIASHEKASSTTLRFWKIASSCIVLSCFENVDYAINFEECKKYGVAILRRVSGGQSMYIDKGNLNFTIAIDESFFKNKDFVETIRLICKCFSSALKDFNVEATLEPYGQGLIINDKKILEIGYHCFYDQTLIQGTVFISTSLEVLNKILKHKSVDYTTLSLEAKNAIEMNEVKQSIIASFKNNLKIEFKAEGLSAFEIKVANKLYKNKYGNDGWNLKKEWPLSWKDVLIEVLVAYPLTSRCKHIVEVVEKAIVGLEDNVELRIYKRGLGIPPGVTITRGLNQAAKNSIIPSIIINGELVFGEKVPSENELRRAIMEKMGV
ncbi:MAG: biotin/lipoate A/B protein ligase family protein [Candidatus Bathyarchaeia archaeon]